MLPRKFAALALVALSLFAAGCSPRESDIADETPANDPSAAENDATQGDSDPSALPAETNEEADLDTNDSGAEDDATSTLTPDEPQLSDDDVALIENLAAGEQVVDAQGNLVSVYGIRDWPQSFDELDEAARADLAFFGDVDVLNENQTALVAMDVAVCGAGVDSEGSGTAEFFAESDLDVPLGDASSPGRAILARHPVVQPGFNFPAAAECSRGWLPVLRSGGEVPTVARYVLATRQSGSTEVERFVYQWQIEPGTTEDAAAEETAAENSGDGMIFQVGQTVTFNETDLEGTTVNVEGWSELVGSTTSIEGTRPVAVSLNYCPASEQLPEFGLVVDGWALLSTSSTDDLLGARSAADPSQGCFDGWLQFAVPFGGIPTGFFASDGNNAVDGYAEWSLVGAALAPPQ